MDVRGSDRGGVGSGPEGTCFLATSLRGGEDDRYREGGPGYANRFSYYHRFRHLFAMYHAYSRREAHVVGDGDYPDAGLLLVWPGRVTWRQGGGRDSNVRCGSDDRDRERLAVFDFRCEARDDGDTSPAGYDAQASGVDHVAVCLRGFVPCGRACGRYASCEGSHRFRSFLAKDREDLGVRARPRSRCEVLRRVFEGLFVRLEVNLSTGWYGCRPRGWECKKDSPLKG